MRIGIDIDDTIADSYEVTFAYAQKYTVEILKKIAKIHDLPNIKNHHYISEIHVWSKEEEMHFWYKYYPTIVKEIKPFTLAVPTIKKLKEEGNEIIIITARWQEPNCDVAGATIEWLKKYDIPYDDISFDVEDKATVALDKKIDCFIDDSFENCKSVADVGIKTYIMNSRMNKGLDDEKITRVYSWPDFYNKIKFC